MAIILPTSKIEAISVDPRFLIVFGKPKCGKSTLAAQLDDNLILDMEDGYTSITAMKVVIKTFDDLVEVIKQLTAYKTENKKNKYRYITIDNGTVLEEILLPYAKALYVKTPAGKRFNGDDVRDLEMGAGYKHTRAAFLNILDKLKELCDTLILVCHTKDATINKDGQELSEMSIALTGALSRIVAANADAIGFLYRKKHENVLNFNGGGDFIVEARPMHLRGKEIILGTSDPLDDNSPVVAHWDKIFLDLNNEDKKAA